MQSLRLPLSPARRLFSTKVPDRIVEPTALSARTASTPRAVRLRRQKKFGPVVNGESDTTPEGLTPTENSRFARLRALDKLEKGKQTSEAWMKETHKRRSRIRGLKIVQGEDGTQETEVLGRRVYLPNTIFKLVRNNTPPGRPYNPYEATFRLPMSVTKTDIRSYLSAIYGVKTTYIRTDNYIAPEPSRGAQKKTFKTFKRAVVGLVDPFYFPHRVEDMAAEERAKFEQSNETLFQTKSSLRQRKMALLRLTKGVEMQGDYVTRRAHILRLVAERRAKRERLVNEYATEIQETRGKGRRLVAASILTQASSPQDLTT